MDDFLKQRLLGAIAIIGLAIIFVPALLDRNENVTLVETMKIPPRPEIVKDFDIEKALDKKEKALAKQEIKLPDPLEIDPSEIKQEPINVLKDAHKSTPAQPEKVPVETSEKSKTEATPDTAIVKTEPKVDASKASTAISGDIWVVQLGSFSQQANAEKLKNKLISKYPKLYIEKIRIPGGQTYRVRLGDFTDKNQAINTRRAIKSKYNIAGVIMAKE